MELLTRPRDEACRVVALKYLDEAVLARSQLGHHPEALHDLRVALRRFRSTLRAWRKVLGRLRGRRRKQLRRIIDATSAGTATVRSAITGASGINKTGSGTVVLSGSLAYTGNTTIGVVASASPATKPPTRPKRRRVRS